MSLLDLLIAHPSAGDMAQCETNLAYVRLVPMNAAAIAEWHAEQPRNQTRRLIANYDGVNLRQ